MSGVPTVTLNNGVAMPQLGFGVFQVPDDETAAAVTSALETGYRSIDTAAIYGNEAGVGTALEKSGIPRDELFVTTKVWNADQGYDRTLAAFDASLEKLRLDRIDLYLVHWPTPARDLYVDTWKAFNKLLGDGRVRAIGVSNFQEAHLRRVIDEVGVVPSVNQIELHPLLQQEKLRSVHAELGIHTEAWSPLAQGGELLKDPVLAEIAAKHGRSAAQVILRWHLQLGNVVIPKSVTPKRIAENFDVFGFELDQTDLDRIATLNKNERTGFDPDEFNAA
ncbi:aldo/keto reductase [Allokutzneria sp. A3M-2-11 16]|uniref:aldo/keto reductase n=1 Tax=Allokutzneria sp. A3M-2-11 16 TaxID=2962043 RepID=UPI0020B716B6|nr:aldo/keto reductase [Allokutzneria sp. A3M-2-11 16]MCP3800867.1 aldo/keto reductase [Allokutzneria sp. A3M-2-11 16]